jgi:hypothetical protein
MTNSKDQRKSLRESKPPRNPGQSLDEEITKIFEDKVVAYALMMGFAGFATLLEWMRFLRPAPPYPLLFTAVGIAVWIFCGFKLYGIKKRLGNLKQGRDGERAVAHYLEELRRDGALVLHDIVAEGFNIDHVVVSEQGVFAVETKTFSKPAKGQCVIEYDGESLTFDNGFKSPDILTQARANAGWLGGKIEELTGKTCLVMPVVLFPGWYVKPIGKAQLSGVWVLNPKALPAFLAKKGKTVRPEDARAIFNALSRYARTI